MRFNEAAGIHRRKPRCASVRNTRSERFNEAAGIHRRKPVLEICHYSPHILASMRPPEFTGGNGRGQAGRPPDPVRASMRPPEFTGGNGGAADQRLHVAAASMRPPEFTGGNADGIESRGAGRIASMRPPEFTGGNDILNRRAEQQRVRFNEAAGIHRRKHGPLHAPPSRGTTASMRPPEFTGGNSGLEREYLDLHIKLQ